MADIPMAEQAPAPEATRSLGVLVNWAGAAVSLALVAGTCVWGYKLLVRDVSGVPVVRAVEGPMRIQPDDPGGRPAAHQGLAVNAIAAEGEAAKPADRLVLAPPPVGLQAEDSVVTAAAAPLVAQSGTPQKEVEPAIEQQDIVAPAPLDLGNLESIEAFAQQVARDVKPLEADAAKEMEPVKVALKAPEEKAPEPEAVETPAAPPEILGGLKKSLRPQLRPEGLGKAVEVASADPAVAAPPEVVDPENIPAGTHLVQLGAFASAEIAREEWDKMNDRFGDYLGDKSRVIQKAKSGGRDFYRLRAMGFADLSDARRLCSALKAENADCIPVTTR